MSMEGFCEAKKQELIGQIPVKSKAKPRKIEKKTVLILRDDEKVAIRKRPAKGLLAGLYELPNVEGNMGQEEVLSMVKEMGYAPIRIQPLGEAKHIFSHIEWHMTGYAVRVEEPEMHPQVQCEKIVQMDYYLWKQKMQKKNMLFRPLLLRMRNI